MQYRVANGIMEEYPDGTLIAKDGSTLAQNGVFDTKAEAKAFKLDQLNSELANHQIAMANIQRHVAAVSALAEE